MQKIHKVQEAPELTQWKSHNAGANYRDLENSEEGKRARVAIRRDCIKEQKGLCAFCCKSIAVTTAHNAHIKDQNSFPKESLLWENIVASCETKEHCGHFQGTKELPLTPLMENCESELNFYVSGKITALTDDAQRTLLALNLNEKSLRQRRRKAIRDLAFSLDFHPIEDIATWDSDLQNCLIEECLKEDEHGNIAPFAPVLVNIARQYIS